MLLSKEINKPVKLILQFVFNIVLCLCKWMLLKEPQTLEIYDEYKLDFITGDYFLQTLMCHFAVAKNF